MDNYINIEVVYALAERQTLLTLTIDKDTGILDAIKQSGILAVYPEIDITKIAIGIFGKKLVNPNDYRLQEGDRIEIYRPLLADPKEIRRLRAERAANKKA